MKQFYTFLFVLFCSFNVLYSQIAITELSYNPPESGNDSLEYIEIYNFTTLPVNLQGYRFTRGVDYIFPDTSLLAGGYIILTIRKSSFESVYGVPAVQWTSGALNNGGERITIVNAANVPVVDFTYANTAPWPTSMDGTNGEGRSIELCHPSADANDGSNWKVSENDLGFQINGKQVFGTPGAANSIEPCGAEPDVTVLVSSNVFTPRDITIDVGQTVRWINTGGVHNINGSKTVFPDNPESFGNGAESSDEWTYDFTFTKEGLYQYQCDPHVDFDMKGTVTVLGDVVTDPYPRRTIAEMKTVNTDGLPDSLNIPCTLRGVVHGGNFRTAGLQFFIVDGTGKGMSAFSSSSTYGYTVTEGDEVDIKGVIEQFNGLTQLVLADVVKISENNTLTDPKLVTVFVEEDESSPIMVENLTFVNPAQWTGTGAGFNVTMTNGSTNYSLRIFNGTDSYSAPIPDAGSGNSFNVAGILTQFDSDVPYTSGYQLAPRYLADFMSVSNTADATKYLPFSLYPNPTGHWVEIKSLSEPDKVILYDISGKIVDIILNSKRIDTSSLKEGTYLLEVFSGDSKGVSRLIKM